MVLCLETRRYRFMETGSLNSIGIAMHISYLHEIHRNITFFFYDFYAYVHAFFFFFVFNYWKRAGAFSEINVDFYLDRNVITWRYLLSFYYFKCYCLRVVYLGIYGTNWYFYKIKPINIKAAKWRYRVFYSCSEKKHARAFLVI